MRLWNAAIIVLVMGLVSGQSRADSIKLKSGRVIDCTVIGEEGNEVYFKFSTSESTYRVQKELIRSVQIDDAYPSKPAVEVVEQKPNLREPSQTKFSIGPGIGYFTPKDSDLKDVFGSGITYDINASLKINELVSLRGGLSYFKKDNKQTEEYSRPQTFYQFDEISNQFIPYSGSEYSVFEDTEEYSIIPIMMNLMLDFPNQTNTVNFAMGAGAGVVVANLDYETKTRYAQYVNDPVYGTYEIYSQSGGYSETVSDNPFGLQVLADLDYKINRVIALGGHVRYLTAKSGSEKFDSDLGGYSFGAALSFMF
ncbi:MAG: hypothetical protein GF384_05390 [Elusimicrobia bacterium]|nr:hypothetical protein [Elusimicrobiota bacterium]MBD3412214.1 hypothetical protein [Elusimicrobiota bacterium]